MNELAYKRSDTALVADVGEDIVALNVKRGFTYGMTGVTAAVWQLLAEPRDLDQLCVELLSRYEVDVETCRDQVSRLLEEMIAEGLVERTTGFDRKG
jgi:hypothetical protein